jgi:hypothetical protein
MIAALFVAKGGCYFGLPNVDPWDEARDARLYDGPWPVVAHPPCARWCVLAGLVEARYGYKKGDDGGTFAAALESVRRFGGVLEHPAYSAAFAKFGLSRPIKGAWIKCLDGGWVTHVEQVAYGHPARKATWLYASGCELPSLRWKHDAVPTHNVSWVGSTNGKAGKESKKRKYLDGGAELKTPTEFRDLLLGMAKSVRR